MIALTAAGLSAVAFPACSSSSSTDSSSADQTASLCGSDPRAQSYQVNMVQKSASGAYGVKLMSVSPWPLVKGDNAWIVQIVDAAGNPASGATFTLKPFMPDHGHGTSILPDIEPSEGEATYNVGRINTFMAGIWQFTFSIAQDTKADSALVTFCVPD